MPGPTFVRHLIIYNKTRKHSPARELRPLGGIGSLSLIFDGSMRTKCTGVEGDLAFFSTPYPPPCRTQCAGVPRHRFLCSMSVIGEFSQRLVTGMPLKSLFYCSFLRPCANTG